MGQDAASHAIASVAGCVCMRAFAYFSKRVFRSVSFSANRPRSTSMMWSACILSASDRCSTALVCVELLNVPWRGAVDNVRVRRWLRANVTEERRLERTETGPPKASEENKPSESSKESADPEEAKVESLEEAEAEEAEEEPPLVKGEEEEGEGESLEAGDRGEEEEEKEGEEDLGDDRSRGEEEEEREGVRTISCSMAPRAMRAENAAKVTSPSKSSPSPLLAT